MDFTYLVDSGAYDKADLPDGDQRFIEGIEFAYDTVESFIACRYDENCRDDSVLDRIRAECAVEVLDEFRDWLRAEMNEHIVVLNDNAAAAYE